MERLSPPLFFTFTQTRGLIAAPGPRLAFLWVPQRSARAKHRA